MSARTPESIATELGLKFDVQSTPDGKWRRFRFDFPDYDKVAVDAKTVSFRGVPKDYEAPKNFIETVQRVTKWREKCKPWLFVGTTDTVAAELTLWTRATVYKFNRANSRKLKAAAKLMEASESYARQLAASQPTPMQGVRILDELTKLAEPATQALRKQLIEAAQVAEARVLEAKAHADGTCSCATSDPSLSMPCPVAVFEAAVEASKAEESKGADVIPLRKAVG